MRKEKVAFRTQVELPGGETEIEITCRVYPGSEDPYAVPGRRCHLDPPDCTLLDLEVIQTPRGWDKGRTLVEAERELRRRWWTVEDLALAQLGERRLD